MLTVRSPATRRAWPIVLLICVLLSGTVAAQLQHATVMAVLLDARQTPMAAVPIVLADPLGAELQRLKTDTAGRAVFSGVAPGRYELIAEPPESPVIHLPVSIVAALPLEITVRVPATLTERLVVQGVTDDTTARGSIAGLPLTLIPTRVGKTSSTNATPTTSEIRSAGPTSARRAPSQ